MPALSRKKTPCFGWSLQTPPVPTLFCCVSEEWVPDRSVPEQAGMKPLLFSLSTLGRPRGVLSKEDLCDLKFKGNNPGCCEEPGSKHVRARGGKQACRDNAWDNDWTNNGRADRPVHKNMELGPTKGKLNRIGEEELWHPSSGWKIIWVPGDISFDISHVCLSVFHSLIPNIPKRSYVKDLFPSCVIMDGRGRNGPQALRSLWVRPQRGS